MFKAKQMRWLKEIKTLYHHVITSVFFLFSLAAQFFAMSPFEPWTTPDKIERVRKPTFWYNFGFWRIVPPTVGPLHWTNYNFFYFPVSHNRHEVPRTSWSGGPWHHSLHCRTKGYWDPASPPSIPIPGSWPGWDKASQDGQLLNYLTFFQHHKTEDVGTFDCSLTIFCT